jgi:hypothetical protein
MSDDAEKTGHLWVNGLVAVRDKMPYLQLSTDKGMVAQLSMSDARQVAADILQMAARTEADAMIHKFFEKSGFPEKAGAALMLEFRDFRAELDKETAERGEDD